MKFSCYSYKLTYSKERTTKGTDHIVSYKEENHLFRWDSWWTLQQLQWHHLQWHLSQSCLCHCWWLQISMHPSLHHRSWHSSAIHPTQENMSRKKISVQSHNCKWISWLYNKTGNCCCLKREKKKKINTVEAPLQETPLDCCWKKQRVAILSCSWHKTFEGYLVFFQRPNFRSLINTKQVKYRQNHLETMKHSWD